MKYIETNSIDPYYNLAFEEYVLTHYKDDDYLMLWQNDNTIVVGVNQNPLEEVNLRLAETYNVNLVRRSTGGGAVYHDLGNLNFSYITDWDDGDVMGYEHFLKPIASAFGKIGLSIEIKGRNDLLLDGKKISGSAQRLVDGRILHHGTLLINSDLEKMEQLLHVSADKIQSKGIKSVRSRVTNIQEYTWKRLDVESVKELLLQHWFGETVKSEKLGKDQLNEVKLIACHKYRAWNWLYGRSPKFNFKNKKRFAGGAVEVHMDIKDGVISKCMINGDFLSLKSIRDVEEKLTDIRYDRCCVKASLESLPINLYFGDIAKEDIVRCFFE